MSNKLHLPDGGQGLIAPRGAAQANQVRKQTLVPCVFTTGQPPVLVEPKSVTPSRNYHRIMHVMGKDADKPLCRCNPPDGYPKLFGLSQEANATLMTADKHSPSWHRLLWCRACTTWAGHPGGQGSSSVSTPAELQQAYYDIDDFIAEVLRLRSDFDGRIQEIGVHWPEHVWGDMFGAAQAGLELLREHVGASARTPGTYEDLQRALRFKG